MFHKKRAILVDYMGNQMLSRLSSDHRTLYSFGGRGSGRAGSPVRVQGGRSPWICQRCNSMYDGEKPPTRCEKTILVRVRVLRSDGSITENLGSSNVHKSMSLPEICNCESFESAGDADIRDYELISKKNPDWKFEEA